VTDERRSTVSKTVMPVGQSTRELWDEFRQTVPLDASAVPDWALDILADADARDPYAVGNLLYAWRTGQLA
jgi:hypothetical protein